MKFEILPLPVFEREARRLIRKYPSLKRELAALSTILVNDPRQGDALGKNCYKIRIAIASKGAGKSGGGRVISHLAVRREVVYLLHIYDKSERSNISRSELDALIKQVPV